MRLWVPTYIARQRELRQLDNAGHEDDFAEPTVPVVIRQAEGARIVLGSDDYDDMDAPDIQIERRPHGWMIFLHPLGGGDPSGYVCFLDDGRSYVVPENASTPSIEVIDHRDQPLELDNP